MNNRLAERISALNLDEIASHIVKERRWKPNRLLEALNGYFQFLYLAGEYPSNTVVPWSRDIDVIWHAHILETEKYDADCKNLFGRFIHHKRSDKAWARWNQKERTPSSPKHSGGNDVAPSVAISPFPNHGPEQNTW